ncbi:MAG: DUF3100 domain-containing protein [Bacillota bacterium]
MKLFKDWKVFALCFAMVVVSELIGSQPVKMGKLSFTLLPMLYALVIGLVLAKVRVIDRQMMVTASPYITISVMYLTAKMGSTIGPNLNQLFNAGPALIGQAIGKLILFIFVSIPVGVWVFKMGRALVGCGFSMSRENAIAIIGSIYGLDSPEGQGIMGGYITGTLLGTIFCGLLASIVCGLGIFTPQALAIGAGVGSASMMSAILGATVQAFPELANELQTLTAGAQIVGGVTGMYITLFVSLPLANLLYKVLKKEPAITKPAGKEVAR